MVDRAAIVRLIEGGRMRSFIVEQGVAPILVFPDYPGGPVINEDEMLDKAEAMYHLREVYDSEVEKALKGKNVVDVGSGEAVYPNRATR